MTRVYKYKIGHGPCTIDLPIGSQFMAAGAQGNDWCVWFRVPMGFSEYARTFRVFGTGHDIREPTGGYWHHLTTFFQGQFVWHLFELMMHDPTDQRAP